MHLHSGSLLGERTVGTRYPSREDIIELHEGVSKEFSGAQGHPGEIENDFGLTNAIERPKATIMGREAYPKFYEKAATFFFALLQNQPFRSNNQRVAVAALVAFCELNDRQIDLKILDEKTLEHLVKRVSTAQEKGVPFEVVFSEVRQIFSAAIKPE